MSPSNRFSARERNSIRWGNEIGRIAASSLFPGGTYANASSSYFSNHVKRTKKLLGNSAVNVIYEASFEYEGVRVAVDIFVRDEANPRKWHAFEVKSSTKVKDDHVLDAAVQAYVLCGLTGKGINENNDDGGGTSFVLRDESYDTAMTSLGSISIVHLNRDYALTSEEEAEEENYRRMFRTVNVTERALKLSNDVVAPKMEEFQSNTLSSETEPTVRIGKQCKSPRSCEYVDRCWSTPEHASRLATSSSSSVLTLVNARGKEWDLYHNHGVSDLRDVPKDYPLTAAQKDQIEGHRTNRRHVDFKRLVSFLGDVTYPLYFFDIETVQLPVPRWIGTRPFESVPFQFSLHRQEERGGTAEHVEYLSDARTDPRDEFVRTFLESTEAPGDIWVYNLSFERRALQQLSLQFDSFKVDLDDRVLRLRDLMTPFQKRWCYDPAMNGRFSIKKVLPALVPSVSYESLHEDVRNGEDACDAFESMLRGEVASPDAITHLRKNLLAYCEMDTRAMVLLMDALHDIREEKGGFG